MVKNLLANARDVGDVGLRPGTGRCPGEGNDNLLFMLRESHGQRSLAIYVP